MGRLIDADELINSLGVSDRDIYCKEVIEDAPTADIDISPYADKPKWIPCSETVDIPDHEIMACDKYGEIMFGYLVYEDEQWMCESDGCAMCDPIAWCEKPEPYRGEGDE